MYLVSLYFDDKSSKRIQGFIDKVALKSGNDFMIDKNVPPHSTIASFQTNEEKRAIDLIGENIKGINKGTITWGSIGVFKSSVLFLAPVLNEYLHELSVKINESIAKIEGVNISKYYMPFQWMPHTTIAKKLTREELMIAFNELEQKFSIFNGTIDKIALSKTNPYEEIIIWNFQKII